MKTILAVICIALFLTGCATIVSNELDSRQERLEESLNALQLERGAANAFEPFIVTRTVDLPIGEEVFIGYSLYSPGCFEEYQAVMECLDTELNYTSIPGPQSIEGEVVNGGVAVTVISSTSNIQPCKLSVMCEGNQIYTAAVFASIE